MELKDQIIHHIQRNELKEAIEKALIWASNQNQETVDAVSLIKASYKRIENDDMLSLIDYETASRGYLKAGKALLDLLNLDPIPQDRAVSSEQVGKTLLFLAANPIDTAKLELEKEFAQLASRLQDAKPAYQLFSKWALTEDDLQITLLKYKPQIIHFSGHGTANQATHEVGTRGLISRSDPGNGIFLLGEDGKSKLVKGKALAELFAILSNHFRISLVVLNACHSEEQAKAIHKSVPYVIGMRKAIPDKTAMEFSKGFYSTLAMENDVELAFDLAKNKISLANLPGSEIPKLYTRSKQQG